MQIQTNNFIEQTFLNKLKFQLIFLNIFFSVLQLFIYSDLFFIITLFFINITSIVVYNSILKREVLSYYLVPSLIVLVGNFSYLVTPLIIKTFLFENINLNLLSSNKAFIISCIYILTIFFSLKVLIFFNPIHKHEKKLNNFLEKFNIFKYVNYKISLNIFIITTIIKLLLLFFDSGLNRTSNFGDIFIKFFYGFDNFTNLSIILFFNLYFNDQISKKKFYILLYLNIFLTLFYALAGNTRTEIFEVVLIIGFCFIFYFLTKKITLNKKIIFKILFQITIFAILLNIISNKIIEVRKYRDSVSALDLISFYTNSKNPEEKTDYFDDLQNINLYTKNYALNRFTPIINLDKMIFDSNTLTTKEKFEFRLFIIKRSVSIIPQNIINIFDKNYNKNDYFISNGSYIERVAHKRYGGKYNTGSIVAELKLATNSYFFSFLIIGVLFVCLFSIIQKFQIKEKMNIIFSPLIFMIIFKLFTITYSDGILNILIAIIRLPIEIIFIYNILIFFSKVGHIKTN